MFFRRSYISPLFIDWSRQYVQLRIPGLKLGDAAILRIDGESQDFQYTGEFGPDGAEIIFPLAFSKGQAREICLDLIAASIGRLASHSLTLGSKSALGCSPFPINLAVPAVDGQYVSGPFAALAGWPMESRIFCEQPFLDASLSQVNDGPIFTEYSLRYAFGQERRYVVKIRGYKRDPLIEVQEEFSLGMNASLAWTLNPQDQVDSIVSHRGPEFEREIQPSVEPLAMDRPGDVLCRLQMPVLSEYFIPNNRGWFAFFDSRNEERGMLGILGLYGARWRDPVANMPVVSAKGGMAEWNASLASGSRHWLLYAGAVEKSHTPERRLVFHRLHAEFNALRLDEHLDLAGDAIWDAQDWRKPAFFEADYRKRAQERAAKLPCLEKMTALLEGEGNSGGSELAHDLGILMALHTPTKEKFSRLKEMLFERFALWVRQFQGWRKGQDDYAKCVIGFSRCLRWMLQAYELLRKEEFLSDDEIAKLNAYFAFAAKRIRDEGRWPHSRTWLHPDHPESSRDFYLYGGEHKPDRLVWTNCLPNFQSDPLTALAHLSALFPEHPEAESWRAQALDDLERQLNAYCGDSGAWVESINYALFTLAYFTITFQVLKNRLGVDYFNDERIRRFASWLCRYFGPFDKRVNAYTWPGVGNAIVPTLAGHYLLAYAGGLAENDPLRADCIAVYQTQERQIICGSFDALPVFCMAPIPDRKYELRPLSSECMAEVGVALRHRHPAPEQSYLFQKIGFAKDHYEYDETAFEWYAKGNPFSMDYGTYAAEVGVGSAHNLVEIPDADPLRRGYLANHCFSAMVDYTHCEVPVTLKLLWGRVRSFEETDAKDGKISNKETPYFYIGDRNPVGPKVWKIRKLLFVKPDYLVLFDRVYGAVPHRLNLHLVADNLRAEGGLIKADGRFDLDPIVFVQHPEKYDLDTGYLRPSACSPVSAPYQDSLGQSFLRICNQEDGIYRTLIFAGERQRAVQVEKIGAHGVKVTTPEYTDYIFLHNESVAEKTPEANFSGQSGWIRRTKSGVSAMLIEGESLEAFSSSFKGRGPWGYNLDGKGNLELLGCPPRIVMLNGQALGQSRLEQI